jgi:predicted hotdog family 3-hydroxylacyl-ACP dehydratase
MIVGREGLAVLIPQKGAMCLLDGVDYWDDQRIICTSMQHRSAVNPLRTRSGLSSMHGIEFAAQAMAAHGGLTGSGEAHPDVGLLLSARDCVFHCRRLDTVVAPLTIEAQQMGSNDETRLYRFKVSAQDSLLIEGRAAVLLRAGEGR